MATVTLTEEHRETGRTEKVVTVTVTQTPNGAATLLTTAGPWELQNTDAFTLDVDGVGAVACTVAATVGTMTFTRATADWNVDVTVGEALTIEVFGFGEQVITFAGGNNTAELIAEEINDQILGARARVTAADEITIDCDIPGDNPGVAETANTTAATSVTVAGTGNAVNVRATTPEEIAAIIIAASVLTAADCYATADGRVRVNSDGVGAATELVFDGYVGTIGVDLGLGVAGVPIAGTGAGRGYQAGGDPIDLTPYFNNFCYGGSIIGSASGLWGNVKYDIATDPTAAITPTSVALVAHQQPDPVGVIADAPFNEVTDGEDLSACTMVVKFRGV